MAPRPSAIHIVNPRDSGKVTGVEIVEDLQGPNSLLSQEETGDGGVQIVIGGAELEKAKEPKGGFDANLAKFIDEGTLNAIAEYLLQGIEADRQSRSEWEDTANRAAAYLGIKLEEPSSTVSADGTVCKAVATCMLEAAIKLWGVARGELLPVGGPVKVRKDTTPKPQTPPPVPGQPPQPQATPEKPTGILASIYQRLTGGLAAANDAMPPPVETSSDDLAEALQTDMNHYLTVIDREYYPDFSKMLFNRALVGNAFRKVYRCPLRRRPASVWVKAQDLIVSNDCSHLMGAGRVTERVRLRQSIMRRLQVTGHYLDIPLVQPTGMANETEQAVGEAEGIAAVPQLPDDFEHTVYETNCELGSSASFALWGQADLLDKDETGKKVGYPLPYRVTLDVDTRCILEIRRNWKKGDTDHRPRQRYVKYGFIPGLGFWDLGLIHIVGNPTQVATMIQRSVVDSSLYANFPGGYYLKGPGSRQTNTVIRPNPGEFVAMDAAGASKIQDVLMPVPYKEPSQASMAMVEKAEGDARRLAGVIELPIGEGRTSNVPVGTILAYIETISQVPGAVHKDDHISQQQEFELLRELFMEEPEALIRGNRKPARKWQLASELAEPDLVPAADPNTQSSVHRIMKAQGMVAVGGLPQFQGIADNRKIYRKVMGVLTGDESGDYELPEPSPNAPPPPPPPQVIAAQIRSQSQKESDASKIQLEGMKQDGKRNEMAVEATTANMDREAETERAHSNLKGQALKSLGDVAGAEADRHVDHVQHQDKMNLEHRKVDSADANATADRAAQPSSGPGFAGKDGF